MKNPFQSKNIIKASFFALFLTCGIAACTFGDKGDEGVADSVSMDTSGSPTPTTDPIEGQSMPADSGSNRNPDTADLSDGQKRDQPRKQGVDSTKKN